MPRRGLLLALYFGVAAAVTGCAFERSTQITNPAAPSSSRAPGTSPVPGAAPTTSLVGGWISQLPSASSCGNFQYQIATQTATSIAGTFTATCGTLVVSASANGTTNGNAVHITMSGSGSLPGLPVCPFSVSSDATIEDNGNALRLPYSGTTCLGPVQGTEVLRRPQPATQPPPPASPQPPPPPPPPPAPSGPSDAIDLGSAIITDGSPKDVAGWPITTTITAMDFGGNGVRVDFSKKDGPGRWPDVVPPGWDGSLQYTLWMVVYIDGRWYTSGGAEYWYGLDRQGGPPNEFAYNWYYNPVIWGPLANHQPANGERVGFFVTAGDARAKDIRTVNERSNVIALPFPSGGGYFTFSLFRTLTRSR